MPLTDTACRTAKPKEKPYKMTDGNGLYLEVKPNGVKAWRYRFELSDAGAKKESVFAIGDYVIAPKGETPEQTEDWSYKASIQPITASKSESNATTKRPSPLKRSRKSGWL